MISVGREEEEKEEKQSCLCRYRCSRFLQVMQSSADKIRIVSHRLEPHVDNFHTQNAHANDHGETENEWVRAAE